MEGTKEVEDLVEFGKQILETRCEMFKAKGNVISLRTKEHLENKLKKLAEIKGTTYERYMDMVTYEIDQVLKPKKK